MKIRGISLVLKPWVIISRIGKDSCEIPLWAEHVVAECGCEQLEQPGDYGPVLVHGTIWKLNLSTFLLRKAI